MTTLLHMSGSMRKAKAVIRAFGPDVIVGTGGYASFQMCIRDRNDSRTGILTERKHAF